MKCTVCPWRHRWTWRLLDQKKWSVIQWRQRWPTIYFSTQLGWSNTLSSKSTRWRKTERSNQYTFVTVTFWLLSRVLQYRLVSCQCLGKFDHRVQCLKTSLTVSCTHSTGLDTKDTPTRGRFEECPKRGLWLVLCQKGSVNRTPSRTFSFWPLRFETSDSTTRRICTQDYTKLLWLKTTLNLLSGLEYVERDLLMLVVLNRQN